MAFRVTFNALTTDMSRIKAANAKMTKHITTWMTEFMHGLLSEVREYPGRPSGITDHTQKLRAWNKRRDFKEKYEGMLAKGYKPSDEFADFDTDIGKEPTYRQYKRTHKLYRGWRITTPKFARPGLSMSLVNLASDRKTGRRYAIYVQGKYQTSYHRATGWINIPEYIKKKNYHRRMQRDIQLMIKDKYVQTWWQEGRKRPNPVTTSKYGIRSHFVNPHYNTGSIMGPAFE